MRLLPRWRKPVGDGAKRVRTWVTAGACEVPLTGRVEAAQQVGLDVFDVVQAHRHADQALA